MYLALKYGFLDEIKVGLTTLIDSTRTVELGRKVALKVLLHLPHSAMDPPSFISGNVCELEQKVQMEEYIIFLFLGLIFKKRISRFICKMNRFCDSSSNQKYITKTQWTWAVN